MPFLGTFFFSTNLQKKKKKEKNEFDRSKSPRDPKKYPNMSPKKCQKASKPVIHYKTMIFQKCKYFFSKTIIFEAWRGSSGAQNRLQEVPKRNKKAYRRSGPTARCQTRVACLPAATCQTRVACLPAARCQTRVARKLPRERRGSVFGSFWVLPRAF